MEITSELVKKLREITQAAMMDCKRALVETKGNLDAAVDLLRKSGQAKAVKKAGRVAAEGLIAIAVSSDAKSAAMVEVNCETDFVARNEDFKNFVTQTAEIGLKTQAPDQQTLLAQKMDAQHTIDQAREALIAKLGENINIRRFIYLKTSQQIASYVHGTKIGVLVEYQGGDAVLGKDIAMQIAATQPLALSAEQIPAELIEKEREIYFAQAENTGKPKDVLAKMVEGKLKKYAAEVSLLSQAFVKDSNITIADLLKKHHATILNFHRFVVGEGIEKQQVDFAKEVMDQIK